MNLKLMLLTVRTFFWHPLQECAKVVTGKKLLTPFGSNVLERKNPHYCTNVIFENSVYQLIENRLVLRREISPPTTKKASC